jgi:hypothetical protein
VARLLALNLSGAVGFIDWLNAGLTTTKKLSAFLYGTQVFNSGLLDMPLTTMFGDMKSSYRCRHDWQLVFRLPFPSSQAGGGYPPINLIGKRFHRLTVIERRENSRNRQARCLSAKRDSIWKANAGGINSGDDYECRRYTQAWEAAPLRAIPGTGRW